MSGKGGAVRVLLFGFRHFRFRYLIADVDVKIQIKKLID